MVSINLFVPDSREAMDFYRRAFGAVAVRTHFEGSQGERAARFTIGQDRFAMADENARWGAKSPLTLGGAPLCIQLFVEDVRVAAERALNAGGKVVAPGTEGQPLFTTPDGTECCNVADPFGFVWSISREKA
ncbi:MAG: VOC family protein [Treponema sp.]|nr:VOC family protein [Treponema sp.]